MPGFDKTGPLGQGSQTGKRMGKCNPENATLMEDSPRGRHFGRGLRKRLHLRSGWDSVGDGNNSSRKRRKR